MKQLNERIVTKGRMLESDGSKLPKGVLCRVSYNVCNMDKLNANNRMYERSVWENVLNSSEVKEKIRGRTLWGHSEHPEKIQSNIEKVSHIVSNMYISEKDKEVKADIDVLDTPYGRIVNTLLLADCGIGVSTRAEGELEEKDDPKFGKYFRVIPEAYKFITVDFTADPSTFGTYPEKVERDMVGAIKQGVDDSKIDMDYATVLLEHMKVAEAKTLLETIKADKHHKDCKCKTSEKKCGKGCTHVNEARGFKYVCNACGAEDIDTATMKQIPYKDRTLHACVKCKDVPIDQFKAIDKYDKAIKEAMDPKTERWIKTILTNDEASTDQKMIDHLMKEGRLSKEDAEMWVAKRGEYLTGVTEKKPESNELKGAKMGKLIFESYDDMVEFFKKEFQKPDSVVKTKFRTVLSESLAPSDVSANVRQLKIDKAIAIAERDTVFESLEVVQSAMTGVKENYSKDALSFTVKNRDLTKKLSEAVNKVRAFESASLVTMKTISDQTKEIKALREVKSELGKANKTIKDLSERVDKFEKDIKIHDETAKTILEGARKAYDAKITELIAKHNRDILAKYFETKIKVSGLFQYLKEDTNVSALLEHCKVDTDVDRLIENISGRVEDGILHSISPSDIVVGKATDPVMAVLESRIASSLKSMGK